MSKYKITLEGKTLVDFHLSCVTATHCIEDILCDKRYDAKAQLAEIINVMNNWAILKKKLWEDNSGG